jgi:hypothetical protein
MSAPGWLYVVSSPKFELIKIGSTTREPSARVADLVREAYGGIRDWTFVEKYWCERSGHAEHLAHLTLYSRRESRSYVRDGRDLTARELFVCTPDEGKAAAFQGWRLAKNEEVRAQLEEAEFDTPKMLHVLLPSLGLKSEYLQKH